MLKVDSLGKRFGGNNALSNVSFSVNSGERVAILGVSGAGKNTLIRSICKLTTWDSGAISFKGENIRDGFGASDSVGIVLREEGNLNSRMTLAQNVIFLGTLRGLDVSECERMATKLLHRMGLEEYGASEIGELSLAHKQLAMLACAMIHDPSILILDRPEISLRNISLSLLQEIIDNSIDQDNQCLLVTTDNLDYLPDICDKVLLLREGTVLFDGSFGDFDEHLQKYELSISLPMHLLRRIEVQMINEWKSENIRWRIEHNTLLLNYNKAHQALTTLQWVQQQNEMPTNLTIETLPLEKAFRQLEF